MKQKLHQAIFVNQKQFADLVLKWDEIQGRQRTRFEAVGCHRAKSRPKSDAEGRPF